MHARHHLVVDRVGIEERTVTGGESGDFVLSERLDRRVQHGSEVSRVEFPARG